MRQSAPAPVRLNFKINHRKQNGDYNMAGLQLALLAQAAQERGVETTWEIDGGLIVWGVTTEEFRMAIGYLGQLGRTIEVQHVNP
jgi:hypothetical protein